MMIFSALVSSKNCTHSNKTRNVQNTPVQTFKGRLEIAGICMNYTIKLLQGDAGSLKIAKEWTDESNGKKYTNVFRLGNPCSFPASLKEGDEFYFTVLNKDTTECYVCMAYYPTPKEQLSIQVIPRK
ncbi:MAG: hypothetical protein N2747_03020 [Chitinophagaceae bacterium]|nr:hypothetical protein [Chitinophagaceae bacterium]